MVGCRLPDLSAHLDPVRVTRSQRAVHRRRGWDGIAGTAGSRPGGRVWQALLARHPRAVGDGDPAHSRDRRGFIRGLCVQYRA